MQLIRAKRFCIALSNGNGTFKPPLCYPVPNTGYVSQGVLGDLLNNNRTDVVVSDGTGNISVPLNIGGAPNTRTGSGPG
jgi:hypothetical protein